MPKAVRIIIIAIISVLVIGFAYLLLSDDSATPAESTSTSQQAPTTIQSEAGTEQEQGKYIDYSAEAVSATPGQRVLFFHAPWCPQCRQLEQSITSGAIPANVTIFKVDYDSNQKLRQQYGVTIQTTLVLLDESGKEIKKYVAYDQPSLDALVKNLL
jgi:thiol-disulfide isomerase/thioredoxin